MPSITKDEARQLGAALMERYRLWEEARTAAVPAFFARARERAHPCAREVLGILSHQYCPVPPDFRVYRCHVCGAEIPA